MQVTVAVVGSRHEATLVVGMLEAHGVRAWSSADDAGGVDLALQSQGVRVLVDEADVPMARELLGEDAAPEPPRPNSFQRWLARLLGSSPR